ncbi:pitrilysin family protein [Brevundimonas sp. 2R-24]|uniref:Pitrilysin family protein n=1 Tax=Peiella sedimenti TaxID=3061083 RepID=A0ABT8SJQ5_9CAUL|nr:pitrilysin family protein [Caulobacteraceae bacterium XZ-24]
MSARLHELPGGVRLICDPVPGARTIALSVVADGGARHESAAQSGWSHLLEHMVFKGAGGRGAKALVEAVEGEGGSLNAATGHERTSFQARVLPDGLDTAVSVIMDMVGRPWLKPDDLERERDVIAQEIAEAYDAPDDHVFEMAQAAAFHDQALGRPILGEEVTLAAADPEALSDWRARLYRPQGLVISAAGAVDEDRLIELADRCLEEAAIAPSDHAYPSLETARFHGGPTELVREIEQANLVFLIEGEGAMSDDLTTARLAAELLGGGMSSRLFQTLREDLGLVYAVDAWADAYADTGVLGLFMGTDALEARRAAGAAAEVIRRLADDLTEDELARARAQLKASLYIGDESLPNRAERNAVQLLAQGRIKTLGEMAEEVEAVSAQDVRLWLGSRLILHPAAACLGPAEAVGAPEAFIRRLAA